MPQPRQVHLSQQQEQELCWVRDHHPKAYLRLKAAGILKVASGLSIRQVARIGLLKPVRQETVSDWIDRYLDEGIDGLLVGVGRGRKPAFSPCAPERPKRGRRGGPGSPS